MCGMYLNLKIPKKRNFFKKNILLKFNINLSIITIFRSSKRKQTNEAIDVATTSKETQNDFYNSSDDENNSIKAKRFKKDTEM
jgi:diketogulonate reductase-like aldo/keto reductase